MVPYQVLFAILYKLKIVDKKKFKEAFFCFIKLLPNVENMVKKFWDKKQDDIKEWYLEKKTDDDLIISASPFFLLNDICLRIGIKNLIASEVDISTGKFVSNNCYGEEKVKRFREVYPDGKINNFFSDSLTDKYMADIAEKSYLVKGNQVLPWPLEK